MKLVLSSPLMRRTVLTSVCSFLVFTSLFGQLTLLKDINQMPDAIGSGVDPRQMIEWNGTLLFAGRSEKGYELWKSDGTNTQLLKDINPGTRSSNPISLTAAGDAVYFIADDGLHGPSLWKTDGTESGTVWVKSLPGMIAPPPIINLSPTNAPCIFIQASDRMFFAVRKSPWLWDLWVSDGTTNGTFIIRNNFHEGESGAEMFAVINNALIFPTTTQANGTEIWRSDGTPGGTQLLKDIVTGTGSSYPSRFVKSGAMAYFLAGTPEHGTELWKTNGTNAGTQMVRDIRPGTESSNPSNLLDFNGTLLFHATNGTNVGLWKSDGTPAGTVFIHNTILYNKPFVIGDNVFYAKANGIVFYDYELWSWNGTTQTSTYITTLEETFGSPPTNMLAMDGVLYFVAHGANASVQYTQQIWRSDGTGPGTYPITAFQYNETLNSQRVSYLTKVGPSIFFSVAANADSGNELWKTDGTAGNAMQLTDLPVASFDGYNFDLAVMNGALYFPAGTQTNGLEPWKSDGTAAGTVMLRDIVPGGQYSSSSPAGYLVKNNTLFFVANQQLWKSNGTTGGTVAVANTGSVSSLGSFAFLDNDLYFTSSDPTYGYELRKLKAPYQSAEVVKDIVAGPNPSNPYSLVAHKNAAYFAASSNSGFGLWKSEGTGETTTQVRPFNYITRLISSGNFVYFFGDDGTHGLELWRSDGTEAGTVLVKDISAGSTGTLFQSFVSAPQSFVAGTNNVVYFIVDDSQYGAELWKSDGTAAGTSIVKDIFPGTQGASISDPVFLNGFVYFDANDGVHGREPWRSDGTLTGTMMISDVNTGPHSSDPDNFLFHEGAVYFTAYDNTTRALWKTTGKECGTIRLNNDPAIIAGGTYRNIAMLNNTIFLEAWSVTTGWELFKYDIANDPVLGDECKLGQTIAFEAIEDKVYGNNFNLSAVASSGLPVQFTTTTPNLVSINGSQVTLLKSGSATITATQAGNRNVGGSQAAQSFNIRHAEQSITLQEINDQVFGAAPFELSGSSTSGLPLSYSSSDASVASVTGRTVTIHKPGNGVITASQQGDGRYLAAPNVQRSFVISKAPQQIVFETPGSKAVDSAPFDLQATSSAGLAINFTALSSNISIEGSTVTPVSPGVAVIQARQPGNEFYFAADPVDHSICIAPPKPTLTLHTISEGFQIVSDAIEGSTNQWFLNGDPIPDESDNTLAVLSSGVYTVEISVEGCVSDVSDGLTVAITAVERPSPGTFVHVYPNPASGTLIVEVLSNDRTLQLEIIDPLGQRVLSESISSASTSLDISRLLPSVYLIRLYGGPATLCEKLVVRR